MIQEDPREPIQQAGAIPYRLKPDQSLELLMITSRKTRRWIFPKGWIDEGLSDAESAMQEAFEEAGVVGELQEPVGQYRYTKKDWPCVVTLFPLEVRELRERWPEMHSRKRSWFPVEDARKIISDPGILALVEQLIERFSASELSSPTAV